VPSCLCLLHLHGGSDENQTLGLFDGQAPHELHPIIPETVVCTVLRASAANMYKTRSWAHSRALNCTGVAGHMMSALVTRVLTSLGNGPGTAHPGTLSTLLTSCRAFSRPQQPNQCDSFLELAQTITGLLAPFPIGKGQQMVEPGQHRTALAPMRTTCRHGVRSLQQDG
jgi:hypothetical protein